MRSHYPEIRPIIQSSAPRTRLKRLNPIFQVWKMLLDAEDFAGFIIPPCTLREWIFEQSDALRSDCLLCHVTPWGHGSSDSSLKVKKGSYIYFYLFSATGGRFPLLPMLLPSCWPTNFTHTQVVFVHFVHSPPANRLMKGFILVPFWLALYSSLFGCK